MYCFHCNRTIATALTWPYSLALPKDAFTYTSCKSNAKKLRTSLHKEQVLRKGSYALKLSVMLLLNSIDYLFKVIYFPLGTTATYGYLRLNYS